MSTLLLGLGMVLVIEGLVLALAPLRIDDLLRFMASLSRDQRRGIGLLALALGTALIFFTR